MKEKCVDKELRFVKGSLKGFTLLISNEEDMDDIIKIIVTRKFRCIIWWNYWNSKAWSKKQERGFLASLLAPIAASLIALVASPLVKAIFGKGVTRAGIVVTRTGGGCNNTDHMDRSF